MAPINDTPPDHDIDQISEGSAKQEAPIVEDDQLTAVDAVKDDQGPRLVLESITPPSVEELLAFVDSIDKREALESAEHLNVFLTADILAREYMLNKIIPELTEEDQENAQMVIRTVNFGKVSKEKRPQFIQLAMVHQNVSRMFIKHVINKTEKQGGFSQLERSELFTGISMADATDAIYRRWEFNNHVIEDSKDRKEQGFTSPWHMVIEEEGENVELPYKELYAAEYKEITQALNQMVVYLDGLRQAKAAGNPKYDDIPEELIASKLDMYTALYDAYSETDEEKLRELWLKVDKAFVHQGGSLHTVHPMETGYGANVTGMIPEQSLRYLMPNHPSNSLVDERKAKALAVLEKTFEDFPEAQDKVKIIEALNVYMTYYAIRSGLELVFKIAGHNVPNEEDVRTNDGVVIHMDPDTMTGRLEEAKDLFKDVFPSDLHDLVEDVSLDETLAEMAMHELGHNLFNHNVFEDPNAGLEEWKASALNHVIYTEEDEQFSDEQLQKSVISNICQALRYIQRGHEASQKPYYQAFCAFIKTAQDAEVLVKSGDNWTLDLSREKIQDYHGKVADQWLNVLHMYKNADQEGIDAFAEENMGENEFVQDVLAVVKK